MIKRGEILMLGISAGVWGALTGGMLLGIGLAMIVNGVHLGFLIMLPGAPLSALPGWLQARRLAGKLGAE